MKHYMMSLKVNMPLLPSPGSDQKRLVEAEKKNIMAQLNTLVCFS